MKKRDTLSALVRAVLKRNRMQAAALIVTYTLTFALLVMLRFFYPSIENTFDSYLAEYGMPEATLLTSVLPRSSVQAALEEEGIRASVLRFMADTPVTFPDGKTVTCRCTSVPENDTERYWDTVRKGQAVPDGNSVMLSSYFAGYHGVRAGDSLTVLTNSGKKKLTVTGIFSSPETISPNRDAFAWYDNNDFARLMMGEDVMDVLFSCGAYCNRIDLWFGEGADGGQILERIENRLGSAVTYAGTYEGSETQKQIRSALDGTRAIVTYLPALLVGMGLLFSTLFFVQIVNRGEKQNGLMMAIGYGPHGISRIYIRCALWLTIVSAFIGFGLGFALLRFMLQIYVDTYDLPFVRYRGSQWSLPILLAAVILIGEISSRLSCLRLGKLDPAKTISGAGTERGTDLPARIGRLRVSAFAKMSLCGIYRNRRRFFMSVLSGAACLVLTFLAFSIIRSKNESIRYLFRERFLYDVGIRCSGESAAGEIAALPGVSGAEQVLDMDFQYEDETILLEALPEEPEMTGIRSAKGEKLPVPRDGILLEEGFARRHGLSSGDEMVLNGVRLTVRGITREYYYSIQYISFETAAALGGMEPNTVLVRLSEGQDQSDFISAAGEIAGFRYYFDRDSRKECAVSVLSALDLPCYVFALFSLVIGAVIVSTMNLVTIAKRRKKYAALYVLGTADSEFLRMELPEALLQFVLTLLLGTAPALACTRFILRAMSVPSQEFVLINPGQTLLQAAAVVAAYLLIGILVTLGAIRKMKYLEVLAEK